MENIAETRLWKGRSSQIKNFGTFAVCLLTCVLIVPLFIALWNYLKVRMKTYDLTTERLKISEGVFSKHIEQLELYRVKDLSVARPFWLRLFGLENIILRTSDATTPSVILDYIPQNHRLGDLIRRQVDLRRDVKRVRELDVD